MDSQEYWKIHYVRDGERIFIRLTHGDDEPLEYRMLDENQVDLEKRCIEFKTFNNFFSRGMAEGRRPNLIPNGAGRVEADAATCKAPLVSCADSRVMAYRTIDHATTFWVKEKEFTLGTFLGGNLTIECRACNGKGWPRGCTHEDASSANCKKWRIGGGEGAHKCVPCKTCNSWKGKFD